MLYMGINKKEITKVNALRIILFYFPRIAFKYYAVAALEELVKSDIAKQIWKKTLEHQQILALKRPRYSIGANHLMQYMEWDCALYKAAREQGIIESSAKELIEKINWTIFGSVIKIMFQISRLRSNHLFVRINWIVDLMFLFVFTAPFQRRKHINSDEVAFDVLVCPLATYFREQNTAELTSSAACSLDHHMASLWGVTLSRSQTIAQGDSLCNFRFHHLRKNSLLPDDQQT